MVEMFCLLFNFQWICGWQNQSDKWKYLIKCNLMLVYKLCKRISLHIAKMACGTSLKSSEHVPICFVVNNWPLSIKVHNLYPIQENSVKLMGGRELWNQASSVFIAKHLLTRDSSWSFSESRLSVFIPNSNFSQSRVTWPLRTMPSCWFFYP